jgi:2-oxoglutarate ferredoxin oxidoreductase subunit beta
VEIYQNCNIYNDGAFDFVRDDKEGANRIYLEHGKPIVFGANREKGVALRPDGSAEVVSLEDVPESELMVHDAHHETPSLAFALSRLTWATSEAAPIGVFRDVERTPYDEAMTQQLEAATAKRGAGDLRSLLHSGDTWTIS